MSDKVSNVPKSELEEGLNYLKNEEWLGSDDYYDYPTCHPTVYNIRFKEVMSHAMSWTSTVEVDGLFDLKERLIEDGVKSVDLEYITSFDDDRRSHKNYILINDLTKEDLEWLSEDVDYASRSLVFIQLGRCN